MTDFVCYIPSYNDSDLVAESVSSSPDWDIVISDNASDEPHRSKLAAMAGPRVQVIRQAKSLGRVGNWRFCVEHFLTSEKQWLKLLCAGDRHRPDALKILSRAVEKYPQIRFIVSDVEVIWADRSGRYSPMGQEVIVPPVHAMAATVEFGNIYFGLLAVLVHRDALTSGFAFGEEILHFCADLLFCVEIAKRTPTLFLPQSTGEFMAVHRKTMQERIGSLDSVLEDGLVRLHAASAFRTLGGSEPDYKAMLNKVKTLIQNNIQGADVT